MRFRVGVGCIITTLSLDLRQSLGGDIHGMKPLKAATFIFLECPTVTQIVFL